MLLTCLCLDIKKICLVLTHIYIGPDIGIMVRVFANGPGGLGSISSHTIDYKNGT